MSNLGYDDLSKSKKVKTGTSHENILSCRVTDYFDSINGRCIYIFFNI